MPTTRDGNLRGMSEIGPTCAACDRDTGVYKARTYPRNVSVTRVWTALDSNRKTRGNLSAHLRHIPCHCLTGGNGHTYPNSAKITASCEFCVHFFSLSWIIFLSFAIPPEQSGFADEMLPCLIIDDDG